MSQRCFVCLATVLAQLSYMFSHIECISLSLDINSIFSFFFVFIHEPKKHY